MTSEPQPEECPVCGFVELEFWQELSSWQCGDCSYIFRANESHENIPDVESSDETEEDPETQNWREQITAKDQSEANLVEILSTVERIVDQISDSNEVRIRAAEIATEAWQSNFMHGRTQSHTIAAAIYTATRDVGCSVPPGVIANILGDDKCTTKKTYRQLKREQNLNLSPATPDEYVDYLCRELDLSMKVRQSSKELLAQGHPKGGNPIGIAAAAIYKSASSVNNETTLRQVAAATTLTKETIWRHASQL